MIRGILQNTMNGQLLPDNQIVLNGDIAVWQLQYDPPLLPTLQSMAGKYVVVYGEQVETLGYGGVFKVDAVQETTP